MTGIIGGTRAFALMLVLIFAVCFASAQKGSPNKMKRVWSPPDNSFTVEVPVNLTEIKGEYDDQNHEGFKSIKLFGSSEVDASSGAFEVVILELSEKGKLQIKDKLTGLEFLIGGDDERPTKEVFLKVEGFPAREVWFTGPRKCSKGLIINAGDRIYVLGLAVSARRELDSRAAKRFFRSFHLIRRK